jgi:hypothetical protein
MISQMTTTASAPTYTAAAARETIVFKGRPPIAVPPFAERFDLIAFSSG